MRTEHRDDRHPLSLDSSARGCGFVVHTFRGWLQFNFGILTDLMDRGEAESFLDSYVELLRGIYD